jgi:hypothetical protein
MLVRKSPTPHPTQLLSTSSRFGKVQITVQDRNLNAVEIGWPFRFGLEGCIVDRSQDIGWQRTFGHGREIVPEMLQRGGADDDAIIALGV